MSLTSRSMARVFMGALVAAGAVAVTVSAQQGPDSWEAHWEAARVAAGDDHQGIFGMVCPDPRREPDPVAAREPGPVVANAPRPPRGVPPREEWYAEPVQVFDNLYFIGTQNHGAWAVLTSEGIIVIDALYDYAAEPEIAEGLEKLGLDPNDIEYVVISHAHGDHHGGTKFLQETFGARIVMGGPDWDLAERSTRDPIPERDLVATDGMELRLGETTVTLFLTPGHTEGTVSTMIEVRDGGRSHLTAAWGGTAFGPGTPQERVQAYVDSAVRFQREIEERGADVLIANHTILDRAIEKIEALERRQPGDPHPFVIGTEAVKRYVKVAEECGRAELAARR